MPLPLVMEWQKNRGVGQFSMRNTPQEAAMLRIRIRVLVEYHKSSCIYL